MADPANPLYLGTATEDPSARYVKGVAVHEELLLVTNRDVGLTLLDVSDPTRPGTAGAAGGLGWEGVAVDGGHAFVAGGDDGRMTWDVADPAAPVRLAEAGALGVPGALAPAGDGWLYVADSTLGVVPVDVTDPLLPVFHPPVPVGGPAFHLVVDGDHLYVANGSDGVVVLDRADPAAPVAVAWIDTGGAAVQVALDGDQLYVARHDAVVVFDVTDPLAAVPLAHEGSRSVMLAVRARDGHAFVGDWGTVEVFGLEAVAAGELDPSSDELGADESGVATTTLTNRGSAPLTLLGGTSDPPGLSLEVGAGVLAPGESTALRVSGVSAEATLCLVSDDPDGATVQLSVAPGDLPPVGEVASDFALPTLDGATVRLSEQLGQPVLLVYFATW